MNFYTHKRRVEETTDAQRWPWRWFFIYWKITDGNKIYYERHARWMKAADWLCGKLDRFNRR